MEEAVQVIKSLFEKPVTNFKGKSTTCKGRYVLQTPAGQLPIWIGGRGPRAHPAHGSTVC